MRWIENITVYSTANINRKKIIEFLSQFTHAESYESPEKITIYRHFKLENELVVLIYWESEKSTKCKSTLGLRMAEAMAKFGIINHYGWVEEVSFLCDRKVKWIFSSDDGV